MLDSSGNPVAEATVETPRPNSALKKVAYEVCKPAGDGDKHRIELILKGHPAILDGSYKITRTTCAQIERKSG